MLRKLQPISNAIQAKLEAAGVGRLATVDAEHGPHIVPVCFVYDGKVLGSGLQTETCCTRKARAVAAHHGIATNCTHYRRAQRRLGIAYQDLLALWKDADPDIPHPERRRSGVREVALAENAI
jgi:nitroimidazol reductase NimA-like FMN-containing flavoprotein (pyridoxamine 5'-phosphate oxidase superfamily)